MSINDYCYVDMCIDSSDWQGVIGWVVMADDMTGSSFNVSFEYSAAADVLAIGDMDPGLFSRYRDEFLVDAREAYVENIEELRAMN